MGVLGLLARTRRLGSLDSRLVGLGHGVYHAGKPSDRNGRDVPEVRRVTKEEDSRCSHGESGAVSMSRRHCWGKVSHGAIDSLVERSDHRVRR